MKKKVLVIGDIMLDKYIETEAVRISTEAPVMIVKEVEQVDVLGGAGNTAMNLDAMGFEVSLIGIIGEDDAGEIIKETILQRNIEARLLVSRNDKTIVKMRIRSNGVQLLRVDSEEKFREEIDLRNKEDIKDYDIIVISDYAKGTITEDTVAILKEKTKNPIIINGKPSNISKYIGADVLVINEQEAIEILEKIDSDDYADICRNFNILYVVVTRGDCGINVYYHAGEVFTVDGLEVKAVDVTGAGDTVTAAIAVELADSGDIKKAIRLANIAGGLKVRKDRTSEVTLEELSIKDMNPEDLNRESVETLIEKINSERLDG